MCSFLARDSIDNGSIRTSVSVNSISSEIKKNKQNQNTLADRRHLGPPRPRSFQRRM